MNPLVSVVVPVYNVEPYLERCLDSILRQTYQNFEMILVDDGTPDGSGAICDRYAAQDPRISVIHKKNGGLSSARNAGLDVAKGDYVLFVDSDDLITDDMVESLLSACLEDNTLVAVGGNIDEYPDTGVVRPGLTPKLREVTSSEVCIGRLMVHDGSDFSACDKLFHRSLYKTLRFPEGKICEDTAIIYQVIAQTDRVSFVPKSMCYYCHRAGTITTTHFTEKNFANMDFAGRILNWTEQSAPDILPQAHALYARALIHTYTLMGRSTKDFKTAHRDRYDLCRGELKRLRADLVQNSYLSDKEKKKVRLIASGLFPLFDRIHNARQYRK